MGTLYTEINETRFYKLTAKAILDELDSNTDYDYCELDDVIMRHYSDMACGIEDEYNGVNEWFVRRLLEEFGLFDAYELISKFHGYYTYKELRFDEPLEVARLLFLAVYAIVVKGSPTYNAMRFENATETVNAKIIEELIESDGRKR